MWVGGGGGSGQGAGCMCGRVEAVAAGRVHACVDGRWVGCSEPPAFDSLMAADERAQKPNPNPGPQGGCAAPCKPCLHKHLVHLHKKALGRGPGRPESSHLPKADIQLRREGKTRSDAAPGGGWGGGWTFAFLASTPRLCSYWMHGFNAHRPARLHSSLKRGLEITTSLQASRPASPPAASGRRRRMNNKRRACLA